jgi:aminopeptidase N
MVWGSVWDATRDAETPASDYVRLVLGNIGAETESTTLRTTLNQLVLSVHSYVAPKKRSDLTITAADALWQLSSSAEPGSDAQFQFVKFFAALATTRGQLAKVAGLRNGSIALDGLTIDTDLSWELLTSLVAGGEASGAEIDAALAADNTANGAQAAAQARAAIPTTAGKAAAWASVFASDDLPNTIVRMTGLGFQRSRDVALLQPYVAKYFDALQSVWESRTYKIAEYLVEGMFPFPLANRELADATRAWLDDNPEPAALRRLVSENLASVERALAAQERDALD